MKYKYIVNEVNDSKQIKDNWEDDGIELEYEDIPVTVQELVSEAVLYPVDDAHPAEYEDVDTEVNWSYHVDKDQLLEYFWDNYDKYDELKDFTDDQDKELEEYIANHYKELTDKYIDDLYDYFYDYAVEDAQENYYEE